ncbi:hypothetical protein FHR32_007590 [Streptosporangium album]|uniref:Uncharacterized protein n=1 Tax=Streptosporangium album TaxID=47479 RepID=A0A7W7S3I6_9ACTN|nr:hypothetical protein [Streptosporangium album]MBB4943190.1 hypothetical protein [Streptosporangium album]
MPSYGSRAPGIVVGAGQTATPVTGTLGMTIHNREPPPPQGKDSAHAVRGIVSIG